MLSKATSEKPRETTSCMQKKEWGDANFLAKPKAPPIIPRISPMRKPPPMMMLRIEKIKKKKDYERRIRSQLVSLISISSWGSSLCIAFSAVYGSASVRFERNFTFLFTFRANCLMHFSWFSTSIRHLDYTSDSLKELVSSEH